MGRIANKAEGHARFGKTAQGNYQIKSGEFREEDHPRGQPSNAGQFSEVTGNKKPERPSLEETRSKLKVGSRSEEIDQPNEWLHEYVFGREGYSPTRTRKPGKKVMEAFSKYVPQKAVVLYRYVKEVKGSGSTGQELRSWTYSKEFAESLLEEFNEGEGKVIKKTFYPNEILVDTTLLPDEYKDDMVDSQQEVVIVYGKLLKEMQEVRGTTPSLTFYPIKGFEESKHPRDESGRFSEVTGNKTPKPPKENFHTVRAAGRFLANKWAKLESRYGRKIALGMAIAMIATSPLPGNIMAIVAAAEAARGISSMMSQKELREILIKSIPTYQDNFTN